MPIDIPIDLITIDIPDIQTDIIQIICGMIHFFLHHIMETGITDIHIVDFHLD